MIAASPTHAGAASDWLRPRLGVDWRHGRVLSVSSHAAYVGIDPPDDGDGSGASTQPAALLALEAPDAVGLPNGITLAQPGVVERFVVGSTVEIGFREVVAGDHHIRIRRWRRSRPVVGDAPAAQVRRRLQTLGVTTASPLPERFQPADPRLLAGAVELTALARGERDPRAAMQIIDRLLGYGPGSTPSGDDVMAGFLATMATCALQHERSDRLANLAGMHPVLRARGLDRTTVLSATLLWTALDGAMARPAAALVASLTSPHPDQDHDHFSALNRRVDDLARIGHTSGRDLLLGILAALAELVEARRPEPNANPTVPPVGVRSV